MSAVDGGVARVQAARRGETLLQAAEHRGERNVEGAMEAPDRMRESVGMLFDGSSDPGMSKLHEQRAAGAKKNCGLTVDLPGDGVRAEQACVGPSRRRACQVQLALQAFRVDDVGVLFLHFRWRGPGRHRGCRRCACYATAHPGYDL